MYKNEQIVLVFQGKKDVNLDMKFCHVIIIKKFHTSFQYIVYNNPMKKISYLAQRVDVSEILNPFPKFTSFT